MKSISGLANPQKRNILKKEFYPVLLMKSGPDQGDVVGCSIFLFMSKNVRMSLMPSICSVCNYLIWLLFFNPCIAVVFSLCFAMLWGGTHYSGNAEIDMSVFGGYEWIIVTPLFSYIVGCVVLFWGHKIGTILKNNVLLVRIGIFVTSFVIYFLTCYFLG